MKKAIIVTAAASLAFGPFSVLASAPARATCGYDIFNVWVCEDPPQPKNCTVSKWSNCKPCPDRRHQLSPDGTLPPLTEPCDPNADPNPS
ncbi:hypothetical protein [Mycolicibacterium lutetiense]